MAYFCGVGRKNLIRVDDFGADVVYVVSEHEYTWEQQLW